MRISANCRPRIIRGLHCTTPRLLYHSVLDGSHRTAKRLLYQTPPLPLASWASSVTLTLGWGGGARRPSASLCSHGGKAFHAKRETPPRGHRAQRHSVCSSRRNRDAPAAAHTWAAWRAPSASAGWGGGSRVARAAQRVLAPPGGRVARVAQRVLVPPRSRHAGGTYTGRTTHAFRWSRVQPVTRW